MYIVESVYMYMYIVRRIWFLVDLWFCVLDDLSNRSSRHPKGSNLSQSVNSQRTPSK